jgi:carbon-monoxide dehydrogenase medium subunit
VIHTFEYHAPHSLDEALALLDQHGKDARLLAGGTDLVPGMRAGRQKPGHVINIKRIDGLRRLEANGEGLTIGALVSIADLMRSPAVRKDYPALLEAAASMAAVQIRNLATVGGNLCNASPAADLAPPLIALNAEVEIAGRNGSRWLSVMDFFQGPGRSALAAGEMLIGIRVPKPEPDQRSIYLKMAPRGAMDIAVVGIAVALTKGNGVCHEARIVMGAVGPTPLRAGKAEKILNGQFIQAERIQQAARLAADESRPIDDVRASAWYRKTVAETLTRRALFSLIGGESN